MKATIDFKYANVISKKLLIMIVMLSSCQEKNEEPAERTDTELRTREYILPEGSTEEFPAGFEVTASESIEVSGDLVIDPARGGDFTLHAVNGDITITGSIVVKDDTSGFSPDDVTIVRGDDSSGRSNAIASSESTEATVQPGIRLFFILDRPGATITFGRGARVQSGKGRDAFPTSIVIASGLYAAEVGAPGGDIIIRARGGKISLPAIQEGDPPVFILGAGGNGSTVKVDRENFKTSGTNLELVGGRGGDSGLLMLEAATIEGMPDVATMPADIMAGGVGGKGGGVIWDNAIISRFDGFPPLTDQTYSLEEIIFRGGNGGNGIIEGGKGGYAVYWSGRVINQPGKVAPSVSVTGGNGGRVFTSPLPVLLVQGGEGGEYAAIGNKSEDGTPADSVASIHGANGGDTFGRGGNGGDVLEDVKFQSAIGGDGGNSELSQSNLAQDLNLGIEFIGSPFDVNPNFWLSEGEGGDGATRCNGCPGGNGGNSGNVEGRGGNGGNVPSRAGTRGGRGGDVWQAGSLGPAEFYAGKGGDGNPAGAGGCLGSVSSMAGIGGSGNIPGEHGAVDQIDFDERCAPDGVSCGSEKICDNDEGGDDINCADGSDFFVTVVIASTVPADCNGSLGTNQTRNESIVHGRIEGTSWQLIEGTFKRLNVVCGMVLADISEPISESGAGSTVGLACKPLCVDGVLMWPGSIDYQVQNSHYTYTLTGCNPLGYDDPNEYQCCQTSSGGWYACRK